MPLLDRSLPASTSTRPAVSVVIPCFQGAGYIRTALTALLAQRTGATYEIIVVDSSTDGTDRIVEQEFPQIQLLHFKERCQVGKARNIGIDAAKGDVVLFVDVDTIPDADWLEQMYGGIRDRGAGAVGGAMSNGTPWSVSGSAGFYLEFFRFLQYDGEPRPAQFLVGGNSGFDRTVLPYVEYVDRSAGEDMLQSWCLSRRGVKLLFLPRASITHRNRTGFRTIFSYQRKLGQAAFLYRSIASPAALRLFQAAPPLVFLLPLAVMPWIGATILRRRKIADFLRFTAILPVCWVANTVWAWGFYESLRQAQRGARASKREPAPRPFTD
jgi:cellulose synthase/poly-beta-1,6-N-acetylglucosamine synthase-like glycosyltransferase